METVIYVDVLIVLNFILTYLFVLCTCGILSIFPSGIRIFFGSLIGGISSLAVFIQDMNTALCLLLKAGICLVITLISFKCCSVKSFIKCLVTFSAVNFVFAGIIFFISSLNIADSLTVKNGTVYLNLNFISLVLTAVISFVLVNLYCRYAKTEEADKKIYDIKVFMGKQSFSCKALLDSGNNLKDAYFMSPVAVVHFDAVKNFVPYELLPFFSGEIYDIYECPSLWYGRVRFIPTVTVNGEGLLPCFRCDRIEISDEKNIYVTYKALIAVTVKGFKNENYSALIGQDMFKDNIKGDRNENKTKNIEVKKDACISGDKRKRL